jgi:hypothetical protein
MISLGYPESLLSQLSHAQHPELALRSTRLAR